MLAPPTNTITRRLRSRFVVRNHDASTHILLFTLRKFTFQRKDLLRSKCAEKAKRQQNNLVVAEADPHVDVPVAVVVIAVANLPVKEGALRKNR